MYIKEKRGVWYVINPPEPKKAFKSEKLAKAHVKRVTSIHTFDTIVDKDDVWADLV